MSNSTKFTTSGPRRELAEDRIVAMLTKAQKHYRKLARDRGMKAKHALARSRHYAHAVDVPYSASKISADTWCRYAAEYASEAAAFAFIAHPELRQIERN